MDFLRHKKAKINGKKILISFPSRKIEWNEFVKETKPIIEKWIERSK